MTEDRQKALVITKRRGVAVYATNPSVPSKDDIKKNRRVRFGDDKRGFILDQSSGEITAGGATFYQFEEVDNERFVKVFLAGIKRATDLSKAGLLLFELVYSAVQAKPNQDEIGLSFYTAAKYFPELSERTYQRGLREMLEQEFLFKSPVEGTYFINVRYLFNGDRLNFVQGYRRKNPELQGQLPFNALPDALAES